MSVWKGEHVWGNLFGNNQYCSHFIWCFSVGLSNLNKNPYSNAKTVHSNFKCASGSFISGERDAMKDVRVVAF